MNKRTDTKTLWKLFLSTLYISTFTFGGGFVIVTFMKQKFVDELHWLEEDEMLDFAALAQSSPGAIAVNAAILVGWRVGGFIGMVTSVIGTTIPPMAILSGISFFYTAFATNFYVSLALKGMQAGVAAVILDVVFGLGGNIIRQHKPVYIGVMMLAFLANSIFNINVIFIILTCRFWRPARSHSPHEAERRCRMIYLQLFLSFLQVGMFSIGGGYAAIPLIRDQIVTSHTWLTMNEFTDLITIAEMTPGPIAVNSATFVGIRITGPLGAVIATLGCITPSLLIVSLLAYIYYRYKNVSALKRFSKPASSSRCSYRRCRSVYLKAGCVSRQCCCPCLRKLGWCFDFCCRFCCPSDVQNKSNFNNALLWSSKFICKSLLLKRIGEANHECFSR